MIFLSRNIPIEIKEYILKIITADYFVIKKIIKKEVLVKRNIKVLDIGCGTGILSPLFEKTSYVGIDTDASLVKFASQKYHHTFKCMSADNLKFPKNYFDAVVVIGVIHHLNSKTSKKALAQIKKVLNKRGEVLLIEAIPPIYAFNILGKFLRFFDEGHFIMKYEEYCDLFKKYFILKKSYIKRGGIVDYGVFVLTNSS